MTTKQGINQIIGIILFAGFIVLLSQLVGTTVTGHEANKNNMPTNPATETRYE